MERSTVMIWPFLPVALFLVSVATVRETGRMETATGVVTFC
ncbi:MAG: hypothetical protein ABSH25_10135 [Syntrophorhabdales bacterium]|jgi:hypothetical protein